MSTATITTFFAFLALACNAFVAWAIAAWCWRRARPHRWEAFVGIVGRDALVLGAAIAIVATVGSLYLSEVAHFPPCRLCWYQRIGMYPLAVILPIAAFGRDANVWRYAVPLALLALPISIYHVLLERFPSIETGACEIDNPCSIVWVRHFGTVTIPYMAASAFAAIAVACGVASAWSKTSKKETLDVHP
jgi:disulfide bond formation protein DsbB